MLEEILRTLTTIQGVLATIAAAFTTVYTIFQRRNLRQQEEASRERHNIKLFSALADPNPQLQLAAAAVLVERVKRFDRRWWRTRTGRSERVAILRALIAITKEGRSDFKKEGQGASSGTPVRQKPVADEVGKFVADNVASALGTVDKSVGATRKTSKSRWRHPSGPSPLQAYDWQWANLRYAWWPAIDARGVDFFRADLSHCGMKYGAFHNAQLREAILTGTTLREANLTEANLSKAILCDAILTDANLERTNLEEADLRGATLLNVKNVATAKFSKAKYDSRTVFSNDPAWQGHLITMILSEASIQSA